MFELDFIDGEYILTKNSEYIGTYSTYEEAEEAYIKLLRDRGEEILT